MKRIFIDGLSGMAQGLFATLIIGTIIQQIGLFVGGDYGNLIYMIGKVAAGLTGAGIGVGVARKLEAQQLVRVALWHRESERPCFRCRISYGSLRYGFRRSCQVRSLGRSARCCFI